MKKACISMILAFILVLTSSSAHAADHQVKLCGSTVTIKSAPLVIEQVKVKALQQEYHMTIGGVVQQISGNAYNEAIYNIIAQNKGSEVDEPVNHSWMVNTDVPGSYYKNNQFDFLDEKGNCIKRYDIYTLIRSLPAELLVGYPDVLIYDASEGKWYLFNSAARGSIDQLIDKAAQNGYLKVISDTVA